MGCSNYGHYHAHLASPHFTFDCRHIFSKTMANTLSFSFYCKLWLGTIEKNAQFQILLCPLKMTVLIIMWHSATSSWYPVFRTAFTLSILLISLLYEWRCFVEMKETRME